MVKDKWGNRHSVPDNYDNKDIIITPNHTFREMTPTDILSRKAYEKNTTSTRVNETRDVTLLTKGKPGFRRNGLKIGTRVKNW
jgi:hypothetical protein